MAKMFGTDGIRGIANKELSAQLAFEVGKAVAVLLKTNDNKHPVFLIGKDTRISGDMLEVSISSGLLSCGANVISLGVVPTPAVALLVKKYKATAGIMISASHNPFEDNGIKIFSGDGYKLPDKIEEEIEAIINKETEAPKLPTHEGLGRMTKADNAVRDYIDVIKACSTVSLEGMNIAIDCANGSSSATAETLFTELGAKCFMIGDKPDGTNINLNCGSTHLDKLIDFVKNNNVDIGLAFDGDADRFLCVDEQGNVVDGDQIMALCALDMKSQGKLAKNTLVGTVMSNLGLIKFCETHGIDFKATKVGDRYVLEEMKDGGFNIGGEQSGHIIMLDHITTGDGQLAAVMVLNILKRRQGKMSFVSSCMQKYPQILINIKLSNEGKNAFSTNEKVKIAIETAEKNLADTGRILVRASGTEPLVRVMVEGESQEMIEKEANAVADVIREQLQ